MLVPAATQSSCCTCASLLRDVPSTAEDTEKPFPDNKRLSCCKRIICGRCLYSNYRFASYCPYCQTSSSSSATSLPPRLKSSPPRPTPQSLLDDPPPPYSPSSHHQDLASATKPEPSSEPTAQDTLHFLNHDLDSITSLSLRYGVPAPVLRRANNLTSDHLLAARRTLLIPASHYKAGVSLSPRPVEGEEEERRKHALRRFMVTCKVADYDVAKLYLDQAAYDLQPAVDAYLSDEAWERAHPAKGKKKATSSGRGLFWWSK